MIVMPLEYKGQVASAIINGEVRLIIEEEGLTLSSLFDVYQLYYVDIMAFDLQNFAVHIVAEAGRFTITKLGNNCQAFYDELYSAYNKKVRKALFVNEGPLLEVYGDYSYIEKEKEVQGKALIEVYSNCVLLLPPDDGGRRVPLCFVSNLSKSGFSLTLELDTGECYSFSKLGYDTESFAECITKCLYSLRENSLQAVRALDRSLSSSQLSAIAKLMPEGAAVPLAQLNEIAPTFVSALEMKIAESRAADEYEVFKKISDPMQICVGMKSGLAGEEAENILWFIAPGEKPGVAAVELALSEETAAATFLYESFESWEEFWKRLNQAMEAIDFKREVIRLKDEELQRPEYSDDYRMAVKRNCALRFIRNHFGGRIIHSSPENWQRELVAYMQSSTR